MHLQTPRADAADSALVVDGRWPDPRAEALRKLTHGGVALFDQHGRVLLANQGAGAMLGFDDVTDLEALDPTEIDARFIVEDLAGGLAGQSPFAWPELFRGEAAPDRVLRYLDPAGGWDRWVMLRPQPFVDGEGDTIAALCELEDVTWKRRQANFAGCLEQAKTGLRQAFTAQQVFQHAVVAGIPWLGDECAAIAPDAAGRLSLWAWHLPGASEMKAAGLVAAAFPDLEQALAAGAARFAWVDGGAQDGRSVLIAPLLAAGRVLGALVFAMAEETGRRFHPDDLQLAAWLAEVVGCALAPLEVPASAAPAPSAQADLGPSAQADIAKIADELVDQLAPLLQSSPPARSANGPRGRRRLPRPFPIR
jgi:hypothetical protein